MSRRHLFILFAYLVGAGIIVPAAYVCLAWSVEAPLQVEVERITAREDGRYVLQIGVRNVSVFPMDYLGVGVPGFTYTPYQPAEGTSPLVWRRGWPVGARETLTFESVVDESELGILRKQATSYYAVWRPPGQTLANSLSRMLRKILPDEHAEKVPVCLLKYSRCTIGFPRDVKGIAAGK